jgi:acid phosphatase type 7
MYPRHPHNIGIIRRTSDNSNSFDEESPLINERLLNRYERNVNKKKNTKYSRCSKIFIGIFILLFCFVIGNIIFFSISINNQIHLSYTNNNSNDITVTWISSINSPQKTVYLELIDENKSNSIIVPTIDTFSYYGAFNRYIYSANINVSDNLSDNETINYRLTNDYTNFVSNVYTYYPNFEDSRNVLVYGDMGYLSNKIINNINSEVNSNKYDFILHLGNIAYDLNLYFGSTSDLFLSSIEEVATHVPYMVIPGNHERFNNFSFYKNVFNMPNKIEYDNLFYSIEKPPMKFININTEAYYSDMLQPTIETQRNFIIEELKNTNRTKFPWLIVSGHRPMYCSSNNNWQTDPIREEFETLFHNYNVTLYLSGHEHNYERICPIFNGTCQNLTDNYDYNLDGLYPIHIITGVAGNIEGLNGFLNTTNRFSIVQKKENGYGILFANYSHLIWEEKGTKQNIIDRFIINL